MGKRQHQKDKMYITYTEWSTLYGGKKARHKPSTEEENFRRLPFDHCCLALQPFEKPYADRDGNIFDLEPLLPFLKRFKINPVTGAPATLKSLIQLHFHKNANAEFHCPVLFKTFTKNSHIVAVAKTGNVFSYEAVEQLNIKTRNWKDLINDTPFERSDIITLQDPQDLTKFNISNYHHVKNNLRVETEEEIAESKDPQARLKTINPETQYTLDELKKEYKEPTIQINPVKSTEKADKFNAAHYSTGAVAASFTSTAMVPQLTLEAAIVHEDLLKYDRVKKKGYVRIITNLGPLNFELYCNEIQKTCDNFLKHCQNGYYNGTKFHRSIRNFMIQGGDPTNTGSGGTSIWGTKFEDEFKPNLSHTGRGVLSMANSGPNCNGSQFFITYRSCKQLDNKHTIFGRVVGGIETLNEMEKIEVDNKDRPITDIILLRCQVFVDPFEEAEEQLAKEREEESNRLRQEALLKEQKLNAKQKLKVFKAGVGKYINLNERKSVTSEDNDQGKKKREGNYNFNFNNW